jgi:hypothetical protein
MTKLVNWGHWVVGLLAAAIAAADIWGIVGNTVSMDRGARFAPQVQNADAMFAFLALICAMCAWGILQWRPWGHLLAVVIFAFEVFAGGLAALAGDSGLLYPIAACAVLTWLLVPSVRSAYWGKAQTA